MDSARHQRIKAIVEHALDLAPANRAEYVRYISEGDPEIERAALEWIASADTLSEGGFLNAPPVAAAPSEVVGAEQRYNIVRELGHGGMGTVYLAERGHGEFRQLVALKTIHLAWRDDPQLVERFIAERQILADLVHPNIARLLDGGTGADLRPFLVMEYVDGERIDTYCERNALSVDERVRLFLKVCDAVQYAHRNLVVHRDLKPGNILVDAKGEPKLLDFGIAKLLAPDADAPRTETEHRVLTYQYASPEQIRGGKIGTPSDVYSLGVVLYVLLTGRLPCGNKDAAPIELARAVCEDAPTPPSRTVETRHLDTTDAGAAAAATAESRETTTQLRNRLSGDLDHILLKALRKEPAERYGSASELADDLRRHLDGLPVVARRGSRAYAARKFVARHRVGVAAAAAFVLLLVGAIVALRMQLEQTQLERDKARAVTAFMSEMFEGTSPTSDGIRDSAHASRITVREVLDRNAPRIESELAGQPDVQGTLQASVARVYTSLAVPDAALRYAQAALDKLDRGAPTRELVELRLFQVEALVQLSRMTEALAATDRALADARALAGGADDFDVARAQRVRGTILRWFGRQPEARSELETAYAMFERVGGRGESFAAGTLKDLAEQSRVEGDFAACEAQARDAVERWKRQHGEQHIAVAIAKMQLAACLVALSRFDEAETLYLESLALYRSFDGRTADVAFALNDLGMMENQRNRHAVAEPLLREALTLHEKIYGKDHERLAAPLINLSTAVGELGALDESIALQERSLAVLAKSPTPEKRLQAIGLNNLAYKLRKAGRDDEAEQRFRASLAMWDPGVPDRAVVLHNLSRLLVEHDRAAEAEPMLREAIAIREKRLPPDAWQTADSRSVLGAALVALGRRDEAEPLLRESHARLLAALGPDHERTKMAAARLDLL